MSKTILATGGAGYVGVHVAAELMAADYRVVILDDFSNSTPEAVRRINALGLGEAVLVEGDVRDSDLLDRVFKAHDIACVVHLAGLKAVGESVSDPARYYAVNVGGAVALTQAMTRHKVGRLVFSSSATVYGNPAVAPIPEDAPLAPTNPYGHSKLMIEQILSDVAAAEPWMHVISLRYFNPVGAHEGEDPKGVPNNLFPFIAQAAVGRRAKLMIFGGDWPTRDGTGVRDYIHVVDLARGHVSALDHLIAGAGVAGRNLAINLGTGRGTSVLEAVAAFAAAAGREIPYEITARRPGDVATSYADPSLAARRLGWRATRDLAAICRDHWNWQSANPDGYT
jgi:UDP-glucose 4-epimerase